MELLNMLLKDHLTGLLGDSIKEIVKAAIRELKMEEEAAMQFQSNNINLLDRKAAAKKLGISLPTLDQYTKEGIIIGRRIGKKVLYNEVELLISGKEMTSIKHKKRYDKYN
jgi:hypothetical protein